MTRDVYKSIVGKTYRHKVQVEFTSNEPRQWLFAANGGGLHTLTQLDEATDGYGNPRNVVVTYLEEPQPILPPIVPKAGEMWHYGTYKRPYLLLAVDEAQNFVVVCHDDGHQEVPMAYTYQGFVKHWKRVS